MSGKHMRNLILCDPSEGGAMEDSLAPRSEEDKNTSSLYGCRSVDRLVSIWSLIKWRARNRSVVNPATALGKPTAKVAVSTCGLAYRAKASGNEASQHDPAQGRLSAVGRILAGLAGAIGLKCNDKRPRSAYCFSNSNQERV